MSEKEMNRAILAELYKAAEETWKTVKTGSVEVGSYTAAKVARMIKSRELQLVDDRCYSVTVGDFTCSFTGYSVFAIVAKFEALAGVGSRRKLFTVKPLDEAKEAKAEAPAKEVVSRKEAVKAAPSLDMDGKKFAFAKVGVNVGDTLTFIDGTKVAAADGNKVEYKGKLYTLSGYCKAFMPESKRNKANSYRGCEYFYNADGVKLGKLFKEYQKSATVPLEVQNEEAAKGKIKAVKPLKRSECTITRPNKENATETKERGGVYSWLRRTLGRVHRIAAAFSL